MLYHVFGYLAFGFPCCSLKVYTLFREGKLSAEFSWAMFGFELFGYSLLILAAGLATIHFGYRRMFPSLPEVSWVRFLWLISACRFSPTLAVPSLRDISVRPDNFGLNLWLNVIDKLERGRWEQSVCSLRKGTSKPEQRKQTLATKARLESRKKVLDINEKEKKGSSHHKRPPRKKVVKAQG